MANVSNCDFDIEICLANESELRHDKTNAMRLRPAWIQTSLRIHAV
jgi:hypothetical protein